MDTMDTDKNNLLSKFLETTRYEQCLQKVEIYPSKGKRQFDEVHPVVYHWENDDLKAQWASEIYLNSVIKKSDSYETRVFPASDRNHVANVEDWVVQWLDNINEPLTILDKKTGQKYAYDWGDFADVCEELGFYSDSVGREIVDEFVFNELLEFKFDIKEAYTKEIKEPLAKIAQVNRSIKEVVQAEESNQTFPLILQSVKDENGFVFSGELMVNGVPVAVEVCDLSDKKAPSVALDEEKWLNDLTDGIGVGKNGILEHANKKLRKDGFAKVFTDKNIQIVQGDTVHLPTPEEVAQKRDLAHQAFLKSLSEVDRFTVELLPEHGDTMKLIFNGGHFQVDFLIQGALGVAWEDKGCRPCLKNWAFAKEIDSWGAEVEGDEVFGKVSFVSKTNNQNEIHNGEYLAFDKKALEPLLGQDFDFDKKSIKLFDDIKPYLIDMQAFSHALDAFNKESPDCKATVEIERNFDGAFDEKHDFNLSFKFIQKDYSDEQEWGFYNLGNVVVEQPTEEYCDLPELLSQWGVDEKKLTQAFFNHLQGKNECLSPFLPAVANELDVLKEKLEQALSKTPQHPYAEIKDEDMWFEYAWEDALVEEASNQHKRGYQP